LCLPLTSAVAKLPLRLVCLNLRPQRIPERTSAHFFSHHIHSQCIIVQCTTTLPPLSPYHSVFQLACKPPRLLSTSISMPSLLNCNTNKPANTKCSPSLVQSSAVRRRLRSRSYSLPILDASIKEYPLSQNPHLRIHQWSYYVS
jgi:hypothetical protein